MSEFDIQTNEGLNFTEKSVEIDFGHEQTLELRTGKLAKQAAGSVWARVGKCVALIAVVISDQETDRDFLPLMVDYREKFYAGGRIPGGFLKREARPTDAEVLRARLIDRTIRPLFPEGFRHEVQVYVTVISTDKETPSEMVSMCGVSAALHLSKVPFAKPIAGVRVGRVEGELVVNPNFEEMEAGDLDLIVSGHADGINMVECGAGEVNEDVLVDGLERAHAQIKKITAGIR